MNATAGPRRKIIGIDPGRTKCGLAVVFEDGTGRRLDVVPTTLIADRIQCEIGDGDVAVFCIGHATTSGPIVALCRERWPDVPVHVVDETNTTFEARDLYFKEHPPRGIWRLVPRGLLVPAAPLDGYAAALIVDRYRRNLKG